MKTTAKTKTIFQNLQQKMQKEQDLLKNNLNDLVRESAVDAEKKMRAREALELEKIEKELEKK